MPEPIWLYLSAFVYYRTSASCVALAEALHTVSHDRLTRAVCFPLIGKEAFRHR